MKTEGGLIILTERDYNKIKKQIINGKVCYVIETRKRKKSEINKEELEELFKNNNLTFKDIVYKIGETEYKIREFMKKNYGTDKFSIVKSILNTEGLNRPIDEL